MSESFFPAVFSLSDSPISAIETSPTNPKVRMDSTGFFATDVNGNIVADLAPDGTGTFAGHIKAAGVDLTAGSSSSPPDADKLRWLRASDGTVVASAYGFEASGIDGLALGALGPTAEANLFASSPVSSEANIQLVAQDPLHGQILLGTDAIGGLTLLGTDANGIPQSDFLLKGIDEILSITGSFGSNPGNGGIVTWQNRESRNRVTEPVNMARFKVPQAGIYLVTASVSVQSATIHQFQLRHLNAAATLVKRILGFFSCGGTFWEPNGTAAALVVAAANECFDVMQSAGTAAGTASLNTGQFSIAPIG